MKIYQIHEHYGEYEDYLDRIVGSYLNEDKAQLELMNLRVRERERQVESEKCSNCPIIENCIQAETIDVVTRVAREYCDQADITSDLYGYECNNYCAHWDETIYEIKEIEVEE